MSRIARKLMGDPCDAPDRKERIAEIRNRVVAHDLRPRRSDDERREPGDDQRQLAPARAEPRASREQRGLVRLGVYGEPSRDLLEPRMARHEPLTRAGYERRKEQR